MAPHPVVVENTGLGRFQVKVQAQGPAFVVDEPLSVGGLASGPTPYDLLSAALGACTVMTLRLYAERKGWPVSRVQAAVTHHRDPQTGAERFERVIYIEGSLNDEQTTQLVGMADRCPVGKTLTGVTTITTRLSKKATMSSMGGPCDELHGKVMEQACKETG